MQTPRAWGCSGPQVVPEGSFWDHRARWRRVLVSPCPATFPACPALDAWPDIHNPPVLTSSLYLGRYAFRRIVFQNLHKTRHLPINFIHFLTFFSHPITSQLGYESWRKKIRKSLSVFLFYLLHLLFFAVGAPHELNCGVESPANFPGLNYNH